MDMIFTMNVKFETPAEDRLLLRWR